MKNKTIKCLGGCGLECSTKDRMKYFGNTTTVMANVCIECRKKITENIVYHRNEKAKFTMQERCDNIKSQTKANNCTKSKARIKALNLMQEKRLLAKSLDEIGL